MLPPLSGVSNFRSLKGLRLRDGRRIAGHSVLRSDQLELLTLQGWSMLTGLGLRTVCDLRSAAERLRHPNRVPDARVRELHFNLTSDVRGDHRYAQLLSATPNEHGAVSMMLAIYRQLPYAMAVHLRQFFKLFEDGEVPVLVHCAAGKDRTGFVTAVVLYAFGASMETIMHDYLLTAQSPLMTDPARRSRLCATIEVMFGMPCSEAMVSAILDVREAYLHAAFDEVEQRYGSFDRYLLCEGGLGEHELARLRNRYLTAT